MYMDRNPETSWNKYLIYGIFFTTGLTGLAYELVWIRLLILSFGSTQFAITTVLGTFMAGLAMGSIIFGRIVDKYQFPLRVYAVIEVVLGIYGILSPWIFSLIRDIYLYVSPVTVGIGYHAGFEPVQFVPPGYGRSWTLIGYHAGFEPVQFVIALLVLIVPTTLMGGTLPPLVKYFASVSGRIGYYTAVPYAVNTLGAVTGCLLTGLFALYTLGVNTTVYMGGIIDILVGTLVFAF